MMAPIAYQSKHMAVKLFRPEQFITPYDWTHGRDGNVNPVLHARFCSEEGLFDGYAKPFSYGDEIQSTFILNEVTGWLLARASGLPVPERAFFTQINCPELPPYTGPTSLPTPDAHGRILCFVTQAVSNTAARGVFNTGDLVAEQSAWPRCDDTIAFDEAVANPDRHCFNLVRRAQRDFVLIDHGLLLHRKGQPYPDYWADGQLENLASEQFQNLLHQNAYLSQQRTSPSVSCPALDNCVKFIDSAQLEMQRTLFEISYWCSQLLPGRSARWLHFLYSRQQPDQIRPLLTKRFGLLFE
ncbi:MAG: hypothetical protein LBI48_00605 [Burkholderiaceae bacterium]|jgi:hypothetical protein|nr:hypothetical protein [Burkholderiaceae bacterium]